jgi:hypothetical protein
MTISIEKLKSKYYEECKGDIEATLTTLLQNSKNKNMKLVSITESESRNGSIPSLRVAIESSSHTIPGNFTSSVIDALEGSNNTITSTIDYNQVYFDITSEYILSTLIRYFDEDRNQETTKKKMPAGDGDWSWRAGFGFGNPNRRPWNILSLSTLSILMIIISLIIAIFFPPKDPAAYHPQLDSLGLVHRGFFLLGRAVLSVIMVVITNIQLLITRAQNDTGVVTEDTPVYPDRYNSNGNGNGNGNGPTSAPTYGHAHAHHKTQRPTGTGTGNTGKKPQTPLNK